MQQEAEITVNGIKLTDNEAIVVAACSGDVRWTCWPRSWVLRDDGIALTDRYQADVPHVRALIERGTPRTQ
jgi:hypothetical protein